MIGLILGTSEGKKILSMLNEFTEDIFVSTATEYGASLLENYRYRYMNDKPLDFDKLVDELKKRNVTALVDASHPYAVEVSKNAMEACNKLNIEYIRYERPSCIEKFKDEPKVIKIRDYSAFKSELEDRNIKGTILNTTGSKSLGDILALKLENRIVYRVLPSLKVLNELHNRNIALDNIIALKGPVSYQLNCAFIREYKAQAMLLKDSGVEGGTLEKIRSCLDCGIYAFIIERKRANYHRVFHSVEGLVEYIKDVK
ncbi:cobalt-precorrin-6A reductase [Clostridium luticellarii]|jgi:precorrin-6A/cobalt-precorrin-6A reductase|uniref:Cobalt-precorrin-6x reductase n=1 Tax=Clostridium luticellarii TaxID=1691940 RepID=A0A2T0BMK5_9CLOT|nr:cobalt-precorrin-6A reductase [Clostridium luticellarii]MCI1945241.1 cobalt-precorrin-6A reductase [Clostridium luticellarii]MCI1969655.1 cobalt-precorrin-6A reductase [Clostridium luticellarii]PRR85107.1 cobalt-precorrin-6x reductase [Clostridium luticellarii]